MTVQLIIFLVALVAVIFYFIAIIDIFLRIITYLKLNYLRSDAFSFFDFIPSDIPSILNSFELGAFNEILMILYVMVYIIFEVLLIRYFIKRKF